MQDEVLISDHFKETEQEQELEELSVPSPEPRSSPVKLQLCQDKAELTRLLAGQNPEGDFLEVIMVLVKYLTWLTLPNLESC